LRIIFSAKKVEKKLYKSFYYAIIANTALQAGKLAADPPGTIVSVLETVLSYQMMVFLPATVASTSFLIFTRREIFSRIREKH